MRRRPASYVQVNVGRKNDRQGSRSCRQRPKQVSFFRCDRERGNDHPQLGGEHAQEIKYEFSWPLGDIITALAQSGLIIERMDEFPGGPEWRYGDLQEASNRLPGEFLILARKLT